MGNIVGSVMSSPEAQKNMMFIRESKEAAKKYTWLYHCASVSALLSIIDHREMWLSNLKNVNDAEEAKRIDVDKFEKGFYVGCFTYDPNIKDEHWNEYGKSEDKVLFGVKKEWFTKRTFFLNGDHTKDNTKIFRNFDEMVQYQIETSRSGVYEFPPYFIFDYGFYKIVYDDDLKKSISTECNWYVDGIELPGRAITASVAGIIKSTHGLCWRDGKEEYDKDWSQEKEVRLKVGVMTQNKTLQELGAYYNQLAVQLSKEAFSELPIKFNPDMKNEVREMYLEELRRRLPSSNIYEL